jgi:hypothetical protein
MIVDYKLLTSTYTSMPPNLGQFSANVYMSGIIAVCLVGGGFLAHFSAHNVPYHNEHHVPTVMPRKEKAVFLVNFDTYIFKGDAVLLEK